MRRVELPSSLAFSTAERLHRVGVLPAPPGDLAFVAYPWAVSSRRLREAGWQPTGLDVVIVARRPPISPRRDEIVARLAELTGLSAERISVKGTTSDGLGFAGSEGIAAYAVATVTAA
jgi:hypothetical protein